MVNSRNCLQAPEAGKSLRAEPHSDQCSNLTVPQERSSSSSEGAVPSEPHVGTLDPPLSQGSLLRKKLLEKDKVCGSSSGEDIPQSHGCVAGHDGGSPAPTGNVKIDASPIKDVVSSLQVSHCLCYLIAGFPNEAVCGVVAVLVAC
jgi:hypothetical protein